MKASLEAVKFELVNHFKTLPTEELVPRIKAGFGSATISILQNLHEDDGVDFESDTRSKIREQVADLIDVIVAIHPSNPDEYKECISTISVNVDTFSAFLKDISNTYDLDALSETIYSALYHLHKDSKIKISELINQQPE